MNVNLQDLAYSNTDGRHAFEGDLSLLIPHLNRAACLLFYCRLPLLILRIAKAKSQRPSLLQSQMVSCRQDAYIAYKS